MPRLMVGFYPSNKAEVERIDKAVAKARTLPAEARKQYENAKGAVTRASFLAGAAVLQCEVIEDW